MRKAELLFCVSAAAAALLASAAYLLWLPDVRPLRTEDPRTTSFMLIQERRARARGVKPARRMEWRDLDGISDNLKHAVLVAEDDNFYRHNGIDWPSTWLAFKTDLKAGRMARGGSTITQQVARNLYLSPSKNPLRKLKEMLIARELEKTLGKRRILEIYLNIAEWGKGVYGAQAASMTYFGKDASALDPEEAAALAAVLPSPRRYSPTRGTRFMERMKGRIIRRMRASGYLPEEAEAEVLEVPPEAIEAGTGTVPAVEPAAAESGVGPVP